MHLLKYSLLILFCVLVSDTWAQEKPALKHSLEGYVKDPAGKPVFCVVEVRYDDGERVKRVNSDSNGYYQVSNLTAGVAVLNVSTIGYREVRDTIRVDKELTTHHFSLQELFPGAAERRFSVMGYVTDSNERPLDFAVVRLYRDGELKGGARADAQGYYHIHPVEPGTYTISACYVEFHTSTMNIALVEKNTIQNFKLTPQPRRKVHNEGTRSITVPLLDPANPGRKVMTREYIKATQLR